MWSVFDPHLYWKYICTGVHDVHPHAQEEDMRSCQSGWRWIGGKCRIVFLPCISAEGQEMLCRCKQAGSLLVLPLWRSQADRWVCFLSGFMPHISRLSQALQHQQNKKAMCYCPPEIACVRQTLSFCTECKYCTNSEALGKDCGNRMELENRNNHKSISDTAESKYYHKQGYLFNSVKILSHAVAELIL